MQSHPLSVFEKFDPQILALIKGTEKLALTGGALPRKYQLLIAMDLDAVHGAANGVKNLMAQAIKAGATKEEIAEALRVAYHVCGVGCIHTAASALRELFPE